jgi:prevent-host-death family protein
MADFEFTIRRSGLPFILPIDVDSMIKLRYNNDNKSKGVRIMIQIRPVSDLRNKFPEIEELVVKEGQPVYLTKNGYGSLVVLSLEKYAELTDDIELKLDEADKEADLTALRYTHDEVFSRVRARINKGK